MKVTRITRIRSHRVFRDFTWPADLQPFARFNLIYGWNGSGKTTLASLLRHLKERSTVVDGDVEFEIEGTRVSDRDLATAQLPQVRVFNRDFIASTILAAARRMDPIYYFGEDSVEKQGQIEKLKLELAQAEREVATANAAKSSAENALDDFCINKAKLVKELLISSYTTRYNNYDKRHFRQAIGSLDAQSALTAKLSDADKEKLRKQKDAQPKDAVSELAFDPPDLESLASETDVLLQRTVLSQVIDELVVDKEVGAWVHEGLLLHSGARKTERCRFCDQPLSAGRVQRLDAHFNDAFASVESDVAAVVRRIDSVRGHLAAVQLPEPTRLYDHLVGEMELAGSRARDVLQQASGFLDSLHAVVLRKGKSPFERMSLGSAFQGTQGPNRAALIQAVEAVNTAIQKHNSTTKDFARKNRQASEALERGYLAEAFPEYRQLSDAVAAAESGLRQVIDSPPTLKTKIDSMEREIVEHQRPAEELNVELRSYLGHDELRLDVKDTGYAMMRLGRPAGDLSEGEKTAIAFLYFLKSLQDRSFDLANGVVVIDDPISSLDANALFSAFGYMKERTKGAGQLFVLTHNFAFFRQVKNWFHHMPNQRKKDPALHPARFFLLKARVESGERTAALAPIDPLLEWYESEYHYLFKLVYNEAHRSDGEVLLEEYYGMPNVARRLLETFLAFRYPGIAGDLHKRMEPVDFDAGKKTRILRLLHTYSHSGSIADPEHDPSVLSETRAVLVDLLDLVEKCDPVHYKGMLTIIATADAGGDDA